MHHPDMQLKVIQVNIYRGKFLDKLVDFLCAEQPDVVAMQEVSGGKVNFWPDKTIDTFYHIKKALGLEGVVAPMYRLRGDPSAYEGNAVFARGNVRAQKVVRLSPYRQYAEVPWETEGPTMPRLALDLAVEISGRTFHVVCTHGAWTKNPVDTPEKIRQTRLLADHLRTLNDAPFVLSGDFNMEPGSEVINIIDEVARNAVYGSAIKNTLNLRTHRAAATIGSGGKLVDFIYTSPHFRVERVEVLDVDVSDHLPVRAILSIPSP